jgi:hypothetical protein
MTNFMFQGENGIKICLEEQGKDRRGDREGARNVDIC